MHLRNILKVGNILSQSGAEKVAHGFITSRLDYCSLLLSSCPKNSLIQNAAVRVVTGTRERAYFSDIGFSSLAPC